MSVPITLTGQDGMNGLRLSSLRWFRNAKFEQNCHIPNCGPVRLTVALIEANGRGAIGTLKCCREDLERWTGFCSSHTTFAEGRIS